MILAEFHFIRPYWLLAILPYLVIVALMLRNKLSKGNWSAVCDAELLPYLLQETNITSKTVNDSKTFIILIKDCKINVIKSKMAVNKEFTKKW